VHSALILVEGMERDHPVGRRQLSGDFVGPFHEFQAWSGKDITEPRICPFLGVIEAVKVEMPDGPDLVLVARLVRLQHGIGGALDAALYSCSTQQVAHQRGFARAQIAVQGDAGIARARPALQSGGQLGGKGLRGRLVGPQAGPDRVGRRGFGGAFYNGRVTAQRTQIDLLELWPQIQIWARELGLSQIGVTGIDLSSAEPGLQAWLAAGFHGSMAYMQSHGMKRARPAELVPGTVSVITARMDYLPAGTPADWQVRETARSVQPGEAVVSVYARGRDYHKVLRKRLQKLQGRIAEAIGPFGHRVFTDSAPVLEAELATRSGLGWRGKHTLVLSREAGSMFFLGELFVDVALPETPAVSAHCGQCTACMDLCPTGAIVGPYQLDARRCISYLTIEHAGPIDEALRPLIGNRVYGCDDCQLACPWNKFAQVSALSDWQPREGLSAGSIVQLMVWSEAEFLRRTEGSAIRRIGHVRWLRNLALAAGNALASGVLSLAERQALQQALRAQAAHPDPVVQEQVSWSLDRLQRSTPNAKGKLHKPDKVESVTSPATYGPL
jgi:epoxyqueuosine reductase